MSAKQIDTLFLLIRAMLVQHGKGHDAPFHDHRDLYATIHATPIGGPEWQSYTLTYNRPRINNGKPLPLWMDNKYDIWFRDPRMLIREMISNPDFASGFDYAQYHVY